MSRFKIGQVVMIRGSSGKALIICECKEPPQHWSLISLTINNSVEIRCLPEKDIFPYTRFCWNCSNNNLNSDVNDTCPRCGWIVCPDCGSCRLGKCESHGITIHPIGSVEETGLFVDDEELWRLINGE